MPVHEAEALKLIPLSTRIGLVELEGKLLGLVLMPLCQNCKFEQDTEAYQESGWFARQRCYTHKILFKFSPIFKGASKPKFTSGRLKVMTSSTFDPYIK